MSRYNSLRKLKTHRKLKSYYPLCWQFLLYLKDKENIIINIEGFDSFTNDFVYFSKPYMHKWKKEYMKARLAKFYLLDNWAKANPLPLSLITFTTYHDSEYARRKRGKGLTIEESWIPLKTGFRKASLLIRNKIRKRVPYFWITEPQPESGYPHIHAGYFTEFTETEQHRLKNHWANIVKAGDYDHGLDFSFDSAYKNGEIASLRNYLMKYMAKTFSEIIPEWSPEELVFNAIAWKQRYRFFGCSRDLSTIMKGTVKSNPASSWLSTTVHNPDLGHEEDRMIRKNPTWELNK